MQRRRPPRSRVPGGGIRPCCFTAPRRERHSGRRLSTRRLSHRPQPSQSRVRLATRPAPDCGGGLSTSKQRNQSDNNGGHNMRIERSRGSRFGSVLTVLALTSLARATNAEPVPTAKATTTGLAVTDTEVTVGQLHSATGTMAISETGSIQAEQLAIDQINATGGILGRKIKIIQEDGASDWPTFAEKAKKLLVNDKVAAVFGCWTSASRKAVLPVFEKENGLLYYPTFYEGLEQSKNVFYTGQEATQQIIAGLDWMAKEKKAKTFFLIGSDYIWPRTSNKIARKHIENVLKGDGRRRGVLPARPHPVRLADQQDQAQEAGRRLRHRRRRQQRLVLQAAQGRGHHRRQADAADDLRHRGRAARHRRREHGRLLRRHEVLPEPRQRRTTRRSSRPSRRSTATSRSSAT